MSPLLQSIVYALAAALANIIGGIIVTTHDWARRSLRYFMALGSGFMLGAIFLEMLPESLKLIDSATALVLVGYLIVHMFEHTFASHLHFGEETHHDKVTDPVVGMSAFVGMLVHTFFDGVAIGAGFLVPGNVGVLVFMAVFLHKIPDGFTMASMIITAGHSKNRALLSVASLGFSTLAGVIFLHAAPGLLQYALPISAGSLLYVAATDLMPEVNQETGVKMAFVVFAGMGFFLLVQKVAGI